MTRLAIVFLSFLFSLLAVGNATAAPMNVALGGTATQSSNYDAVMGLANLAIDGNRNGHWLTESVTHTLHDSGAWWQVDLGASYDISEILVFNRTDCCSDRLDPFSLSILQGGMVQQTHHVTSFVAGISGTNLSGMTFDIAALFGGSVTGDAVRIALDGINYLSLAEVEVMSAVPVPAAVWLFGSGILGLIGFSRRKRSA
ncbi:MAG: discoidin domain-containing protein [Candidatus Sedimenticola sp. (ex Thyasira tokunagai)]